MTCEGSAIFDRRQGLIRRLELKRSEVRSPGQVEAGLDFKGSLTVELAPVSIPPELADGVIDTFPASDQPALELLRFEAPGGAYRLYHDRDWHLFWDDARLTVLKRLDHGELVAQCNLTIGPDTGPGRHQDPDQFRQDIREALGARFVSELAKGELETQEAGGFRYKVAVQGREEDRDILWYYFLLASGQGKQVLATFTMNAADQKRFGIEDLTLTGSLEWVAPSLTEPLKP